MPPAASFVAPCFAQKMAQKNSKSAAALLIDPAAAAAATSKMHRETHVGKDPLFVGGGARASVSRHCRYYCCRRKKLNVYLHPETGST